MKASEQRLLGAFLGLLVLGGLAVVGKFYVEQRRVLLAEREELSYALIEIETLMEEHDLWMQRSAWIEKHQPHFTTRETINNEIFQAAKSSAPPDVEVQKVQYLPALEEPEHFEQAGVVVTAVGPLESMLTWVYDLQQPKLFRVVRNIRISPDKKDDQKVSATFQLLRWYEQDPARTASR